ncbi:MAG: formyltetrahydrofolate deformylase [Helicobacteraceae bacterium]
MNEFTLLIEMQDKKGLIFEISSILAAHSINIEQNSEFVDKESNRFFMRSRLMGEIQEERLLGDLKRQLQDAKLTLKKVQKKDIVVFVTKEPHAIGDLLIKHHFGTLGANIKAVVGNHAVLKDLVEKFGIPFYFIDAKDLSKEAHEAQIIKALAAHSFDYIVLAKYMRILTPSFVNDFTNKIINIHHSFLPAFVGANPYKQAFERGVKIIGATSHFVSNDLDEGAIIYQAVERVSHTDDAASMALKGKAIETSVLASALALVFDDRVFVHNNKTVIL